VYIFIFPSHNPREDLSVVSKLRDVDWVGAVLNGGTSVLFIIVVTFGGSTYTWNSGAAIALWVVWGVCLVAFAIQQAFTLFTTPERRIFPVHFLKSRSLVLLYVATAAAAAANAATLYYIPLFFQFTRSDSALQAAVRLLPFIVVFIFCVMFAGGLIPRLGRYNVFYMVGGTLVLAGGALLFAKVSVEASNSSLYAYEALVGAGSGLAFQNAYAIAAAKVPESDRPMAIGFINVAQIGTVAIALAIAGSLFQNLGFDALKEALAIYHFPDDYVRSALAGAISPIFSSTDLNLIPVVVSTIATTIQSVFGMVIAAGAVILVSSFLMPWERLELDIVAGG
jgi:hypothetical protein